MSYGCVSDCAASNFYARTNIFPVLSESYGYTADQASKRPKVGIMQNDNRRL